jgi:hypothetical protein
MCVLEVMYVCVRGIDFVSFYDFSTGLGQLLPFKNNRHCSALFVNNYISKT